MSSTPVPGWQYAVTAIAAVIWIATCFRAKCRKVSAGAVVIMSGLAILTEFPFHTQSTTPSVSSRSITVIGDSLTAGIGGNETSRTWPTLLATQHSLNVQDISHIGETAASALKRAKSHSIHSSLVIVEIGGNDVLGSTTADQFATDLGALLKFLSSPNRVVVMFELPLPPFCNAYGAAQRRLASEHNVALLPKRLMLTVLAANESTLDSIHLTQAGHQRMAATVWSAIASAVPEKPEP